MTMLEIEAFLAVVKYGTLTSAAENLYITQPALTRRIKIMESELGYPLFDRQQGHREVSLTDQGSEFYHIAWKWQRLWEETNSITLDKNHDILSVASVDSLNHNVLPNVFRIFSQQGYRLRLYNAFSEDAFSYMGRRIYDLAFITLQDYTQPIPSGTQIYPAFSESFFLVTFQKRPCENGFVRLEQFQEENEIYVAWNKEFKAWHADHFDERRRAAVILEHAALAAYFLQGDAWMIVPYTTAEVFRKKGAYVYQLNVAPPDQIIYYLKNGKHKDILITRFLEILKNQLLKLDSGIIHSFL